MRRRPVRSPAHTRTLVRPLPRHARWPKRRTALEDALARLDERARQSRRADGRRCRTASRTRTRRATTTCRPTIASGTPAASARSTRDLVTWPDVADPLRADPAFTRATPRRSSTTCSTDRPRRSIGLPVHDYVVTPIEPACPPTSSCGVCAPPTTASSSLNHVVHHGAIGHHVQNHYAYAGASADRPRRGRRRRVPHRDVSRRHDGGRLGVLRHRSDGRSRVLHAGGIARAAAHARAAARAGGGGHRPARAIADLRRGGRVYRDRVGMSAEAARGEACKNSMFPGTALMYWLGTDGLHQLRRERERIEGAVILARPLPRSAPRVRLDPGAADRPGVRA